MGGPPGHSLVAQRACSTAATAAPPRRPEHDPPEATLTTLEGNRAARVRELLRPIAHRGLHDTTAGVIENTEPAFAEAIRQQTAIECDVQATADGEAVVFHDAMLERLTGETGSVAARHAADLQRVRHHISGAPIITLAALLECVADAVPVVVEIKHGDGDLNEPFIERVAALAARAAGPVAVMSFDARVVAHVSARAPDVLRGLVTQGLPEDAPTLRHCLGGDLTIDFIAGDVSNLPGAGLRSLRVPVLAWTVRDDRDLRRALAYGDAPIFEGLSVDAVRAAMREATGEGDRRSS